MECKGCEKGVKMCYHRPCFGTPEEFEKIIDAGFTKELRVDHWSGRKPITDEQLESLPDFAKKYFKEVENPHTEDVEILTGGTDDDHNYHAPWFLISGHACKFLENNLCKLHGMGLKPEQGRESCCKDEVCHSKGNLHYANLWATDKGREVVQRFKDTLGI